MAADPRADGREQRGCGTQRCRRQEPLTEVRRQMQMERAFGHNGFLFNTPANP
jgi:hypothetical protein